MRNTPTTTMPYHVTEIGAGQVRQQGMLTLTVPHSDNTAYHDAQIADYTLPEGNFRWQAPTAKTSIVMQVRARFSTQAMQGTAGFGFWNHPFSPDMRGIPRLPQAAWFFYGSPPNHMPLARGVPGHGWKCATINAQRWQFLALVPAAPLGFLLMRVPTLYRALWGIGQVAIGVQEHLLPPSLMTEAHDYTIVWQSSGITFQVDGQTVLQSPFALRGSMGFIAWVDNQYAIVTPQGQFGWGLVPVPQPQSLYLEHISITTER